MARFDDYADTVDKIVGARVKELRLLKKWSRAILCKEINVTQQMLQKYELATNRISAGRLKAIAKAFNKPVGYFYGEDGSYVDVMANPLDARGARAFKQMRCEKMKKKILSLMNDMGNV